MHKRFVGASLAGCLLSLLSPTLFACTEIQVIAKDGACVIGRSMEFALPLSSDIVSTPRGTSFSAAAPDGKPAMAWQSKYGYVFADGLKQLFTVDGMNEHGLSFEYLFLPGYTKYQTVPADKNASAIPYYYLGDWVLGNFKTVDEVRQALAGVYVYEKTIPAIGTMVFPLHASIHDASGKGIVVEFINGEMQIRDYVGAMTNSPDYDWHIKQLPEYVNLSPYNPLPMTVGGVSYSANGQGAGMLGLPGDVSPSSRFIKMSYMLQYAYPTENAQDAVNVAEHIINNVDIPAGIVREKSNGKESAEVTQWTVFKDLTHRVFYYHTYENMTLSSVDLNKIDFSENAPRLVMPMVSEPYVIDATTKFKAAVASKVEVPVVPTLMPVNKL